MANQDTEPSCPWHSVLRQFFCEFIQFYFPAAHAEIDWGLPYQFLPEDSMASVLPDTFGNETGTAPQADLSSFPMLQLAVRVGLRPKAGTTDTGTAYCVLHLLLSFQPLPGKDMITIMQHTHCRLYFDTREPCAGLALVAGPAETLPQPGHTGCLGTASGWFFPCVWFDDFRGQEAALREEENPFALLTLAHLIFADSAADMALRYREKWQLTRSLFERNWPREQIILLFLAIDWSLPLPPRWAQQLWRDIEQFEEQQIMRYVTSVERFIREREWQQGYQKGEANLLQQLLARRFGDLPIWVGMQLEAGNTNDRLNWMERALQAERLEQVFDETA